MPDIVAVKERLSCRACDGPDLEPVLSLGDQFLQGSFVKDGFPLPPRAKLPLELVRCATPAGCGLVQLRDSVSPDVLYKTYWYRSRINQTMRDHLQLVAKSAAEVLGRRAERVLDIGSNDGTLLTYFDADVRIGVEPSNAADETPAGISIVPAMFPTQHDALAAESFDIVTSIAMFYDTEDPVSFARQVAKLMTEDGVWVIEVGYLAAMLETTGYDSICHEHLCYYSLETLDWVMKSAGLRIVRVDRNDINGGSICCFIKKDSANVVAEAALLEVRALENRLGLRQAQTYSDFATRVRSHRDELRDLLNRLRTAGKTVHLYGASTKGNTLLQFCGIDREMVPFAAERNLDKVGARTLGTEIEILSEPSSRALRPDFYLVMPWHFRTEILARESDALRRGIGFIFPLPHPELVTIA